MSNEVFSAAISRRSLHFVWILDASGSMEADGKMEALNEAVAHALPDLQGVERDHPEINLKVHVLYFAEDYRWHTGDEPMTAAQLAEAWRPLKAIPQGVTETGVAVQAVLNELDRVMEAERRHIPPALVLVSDGQPTRYLKPDYETAVAALERHPLGGKAVRIAIGIGRDADEDSLGRFTNLSCGPLRARTQRQLVTFLKFASTAVAQGSIVAQEQPDGLGGESFEGGQPPEVPAFDPTLDPYDWDDSTF